ncbi:MAG: anthranilate synthase component II [Rhodospirillaceae bacterium]|nr:MAG: anthranilate synthase component II [Rhodospirillaceae bacterium]
MFLLIDNYDSFTYNLWHYLRMLGAEVVVRRNDAISVAEVLALPLQGVVVSPGPSDPDRAGICLDLIGQVHLPVLGVCLGHQAIGQAFGGKVIRAPYPMHGKISTIHHAGLRLFAGLPSPFKATRYHSLIVEQVSLPACLEVTAESEDGLIMGLAHRVLPIFGVQFHPESIASEHGHALIANFLALARQ